MSGQYPSGTERLPGRLRDALGQTVLASRGAATRRDSRAVLLGVTVGYLVVFLVMLEDLSVTTDAGVGITVVEAPLSRMVQPAPGAFLFEPVALIEAGVAVVAFSPLNTALGLGIALLVGLNLAVSYLAVVQPRACGLTTGAGMVVSVPALLAGSACCAPVVFLVLGIQVTSTLMTAFSLLLPVSVFLLGVTLAYVAGNISPAALTE